MLRSESGSSVIIVEHVGGQWPFDLVPIGVLDHLLFGLLLLFLLHLCFGGAARRASCGGNSLLMLVCGLILVSAPRLGLLYEKTMHACHLARNRCQG